RRPGAGPGGPGGPGIMRRGPGPDREAVLKFLREHAPEIAERIGQERERNPRMVERILGGMESRIGTIMAERDREMRELRTRELRASWEVLGATRALGDALRNEEGDAAGAAAERLRSA